MELITQGLEMIVVKSCSQCKTDTKHIGSSNFLQPPQNLIVIVNRFGNKGMTKNKTLIPLDQHITSGQFTFNLHAVIDHHDQLLSSGHYTASVICCNDISYTPGSAGRCLGSARQLSVQHSLDTQNAYKRCSHWRKPSLFTLFTQ